MSKNTNAISQSPIKDLTYEEAYAELEGIVLLLEQEQTNLEATISWFERGQGLARHCQALLDQAELRVRSLGVEISPDEMEETE